jgi:hypothetical protein
MSVKGAFAGVALADRVEALCGASWFRRRPQRAIIPGGVGIGPGGVGIAPGGAAIGPGRLGIAPGRVGIAPGRRRIR